jgi:hypothetical protein
MLEEAEKSAQNQLLALLKSQQESVPSEKEEPAKPDQQ